MTLHVLRPQDISTQHLAGTLVSEGLMIEVGDIGYVGVDLCRTPAGRARLLALRLPGAIFIRDSALWIHTGWHTSSFATGQHVAHTASTLRADEIITVGGQQVTCLERTAIDLLIHDEESGLGYLCLLIRAGARLSDVTQHAEQIHIHGIRRVRRLLNQLPPDLGLLGDSSNP
ncbi:hypothetical protein [Trueperella sp. LYQ143]|uniref:hypothetical protein n=1 Tax=unclassified Trueperella TaxID=2630174 RepID=UPI0039834EA5